MNFNRRHFVGGGVATGVGLSAAQIFAQPKAILPKAGPMAKAAAAAKTANMPPLLQEAMAALDRHGSRITRRDRIGLVDFSRHSGDKRFQLVDVSSGRIMDSLYVSHGRGSDPNNTGYVERFSNEVNSHCTSRGAYLTANDYYGKHGHSRRLLGLDPDNNRALERAIVVHGANYVDDAVAETTGRVGRSLGCFAFERDLIEKVLRKLGPGHLLYASKSA